MSDQRLKYLFDRYIQGSCTPAEKAELSALVLNSQLEPKWQELLDQYWLIVRGEMAMPDSTSDKIVHNILATQTQTIQAKHQIVLRSIRWAAAAVILLVAGAAAYFLLQPKQPAGPATPPIADVKAPEKNRAMITLENGKTIYLDRANNGQLAAMGAVKLEKLANGQIRYTGKAADLAYHTLTNPRGSQPIDMTLSDGSRVWLNAGSSITYPIAFVAEQHRKVQMTGEAYFEVTHDVARPFYVSHNGMDIQVLGTHFNVNAYDNESAYKVTLLEGSVKVQKAQEQLLLQPGQQALVNQRLALERNADLEQVMAWKNGTTYFTNADLGVVLRELERWYDIETEVKGNLGNKRFYLDAPRSASLQDVLQSILDDNRLRYTYDAGKRMLTVYP